MKAKGKVKTKAKAKATARAKAKVIVLVVEMKVIYWVQGTRDQQSPPQHQKKGVQKKETNAQQKSGFPTPKKSMIAKLAAQAKQVEGSETALIAREIQVPNSRKQEAPRNKFGAGRNQIWGFGKPFEGSR